MIAEVLEIEPDEIQPDASLVDDLGIESVDLLDINYKLEQTFGIEIKDGELWNFTSDLMNEDLFIEGKITKKGVEALRQRFPEADCSRFEEGTPLADILSLMTVNTILNYVSEKIHQ